MQPLVLAQLESPAQASVEGYPSCAVRHRSTATQPILSECVMVHLCPLDAWKGLVHNARGVPDDAAGMIK
jgi:hypothetical protein